MNAGTRGLGRGLETLFKSGRDITAGAETQKLPIASLTPNPQQPRRAFADTQLEELAAAIKAQGVLQPLLVRPVGGSRYEIIAGERRWRASKLAGLIEVPVVVRELNDQETLVVALMENLQREDLTPMEEAQGFARLKEEFSLSQDDLAQRLGKSRSAVANTLRLLSLPESARQDLAEGKITAGHARALLMISDPASQEKLRGRIAREHLTVREAEGFAAAWKENGILPDGPEGSNDAPAAGKKPRGPREARSEEAGALQEKLCKALALPVTVTGKGNKGRISVRYGSKKELNALLARLGLAEGAA